MKFAIATAVRCVGIGAHYIFHKPKNQVFCRISSLQRNIFLKNPVSETQRASGNLKSKISNRLGAVSRTCRTVAATE